ncbi:hypothetical protein CIK05_13555 [Bdellovibrio sp. qaytius]|nr:hypothetical protein CIK05_13555 [Bdellovibrio sp. qaytius]
MAQKQNTIKNNQGQALIEASFIMIFTGAFLYLLLRCLMSVVMAIAIDAMAEDYFFCELERKPSCEYKLKSRLMGNNYRYVSTDVKKSGQKITLTISATQITSMTITREFNYEKFRTEL